MIELLTADTPNGKKISIMLEEINFDYKVTKVNIFEGDQFKDDFKRRIEQNIMNASLGKTETEITINNH